MAAIATTTRGCAHDDSERTDALLGDIEPGMPLARYLRCPRSGWDFVHPVHAPPPPLLVDIDRFACYSDAKLPLLLRAVARVQQRSRALQSHPTRKAAFWARVFPQHTRASDLQLGVERWMFEHAAFPRIVLSFHQMEVTAARLDLLLAFLTARDEDSESDSDDSSSERTDASAGSAASPHAPPPPPLRPAELPALGLRFTQCAAFGTESLELLRQFLDALAAHPRRRFAIHSLDLSHNQMNAAQLELLRDLLEQDARVNRIASVALNDIVFSRERESGEADALTTVLRTVFRDASDDALVRQQSPQTLERISFDHASLRLQHFAAMCSAWRYGCDVVELSLLSTLNRVSAADRQQCWRWLAFGLFYPRSTRAAEAFRLTKLDLSRIELRVADAKAFKQTLVDPASELVFHGQRPVGSGDAAAAVVALKSVEMRVFHAGASIYEHARATSLLVATLACDRALEVLATTADGWVCVVYPRVGLGWTLASGSVRLDNEVSSGNTAADQDESACSTKAQHEHLFELTLHRLSSKKAPITTLVECIGPHVQLLSLKYNTVDLAAIRLHCAHARHLDIEGCHVHERSMAAFVTDTRFVQQLESLNLSDMALGDTDIHALCQTLSSREPSVRLRELRLVSESMSAQGLASVRALLSANKTLAVLELPRLSTPAAAAALCREIDERHQDELLEIVKSRRTTVVLLSVLSHASVASRGGAARCQVDTDSVASILTFAGTPVRRRIMWRDSSSVYDEDDD